MGAHLIDGQFQSDKYPTTPRGKVPLSVKDPTAQDLLWEYAQRRRAVDPEFADDLETALRSAGYTPPAERPVSMSTDGPTPPACDREVFDKGEQVFLTDSIPSNAMERWVKAVAVLSGQRVDWHFGGGRARVLALGDLAAARTAIADLLPLHDRLRDAEIKRYGIDWTSTAAQRSGG
jgi:hypothetical protein